MGLQPAAYSYLALGDSYTIGESVPYADSFPAQATALVNQQIAMSNPLVVATTGWTTDELMQAIRKREVKGTFDIVTLLIGVNNQYRGRSAANYRKEFNVLLETALRFAGNRKERLMVISIPDWGVTPFAQQSGRDLQQITEEINLYNGIARWVTHNLGIHFIDITPHSRTAAQHPELLASDGLHPSGAMYSYWAEAVAQRILHVLKPTR